tara:strand:- start:2806 stop:4062 length:1257 start_codon:yes stop_codon:yes gene_type:complete
MKKVTTKNNLYNNTCKICEGLMNPKLNLGKMPLSHMYSDKEIYLTKDSIILFSCPKCGHLQINEVMNNSDCYETSENYLTSHQKPKHIDDIIISLLSRVTPESVLDIGCNDGLVFKKFQEYEINNLIGIEPNKKAAEISRKYAKIINGFFCKDSLEDIKKENNGNKFSIIISRHVLEHVPDPIDFLLCARKILDDNGMMYLEIPYIDEALQLGNPTILWEEHIHYFSNDHLEYIFSRSGFSVVEKKSYAFGGGSVGYIIKPNSKDNNSHTLPDFSSHQLLLDNFIDKYTKYKHLINNILLESKNKGFKSILYGASPRTVVFLKTCDVQKYIDFIIDDRQDLQNLFLPGTKSTILPLKGIEMESDKVLVLLAVGSENEYKVIKNLKEKYKNKKFFFVSLFCPRNSIDRFKETLNELKNF